MRLDSTNFVRDGNSGIYLQKGDCVSPITSLVPFGSGQLSNVFGPGITFPHTGFGACWGWTPTGQFELGNRCVGPFGGEKPQNTNEGSREFIIDAVHFIAPSPGTLRLYVAGVGGVQPQLEVNVRNNCCLPTEVVTYTLTQRFVALQSQITPPGAVSIYAENGTNWLIFDGAAVYAWLSTINPKTLTPLTSGVLSRDNASATWHIAF